MNYTIKDVADGKCAIEMDSTPQRLNIVLKRAFPEATKAAGNARIYQQHPVNPMDWVSAYSTSLPLVSCNKLYRDICSSDGIYFISPQQAQSIIDIACLKWANVLAQKWGTDIALKKYVEIPVSFYREMRKACTSEQHKLFDTIFGSDTIDFQPGDIVIHENIDIPLMFVDRHIGNENTLLYNTGEKVIASGKITKATPEQAKEYYPKYLTPCLVQKAGSSEWILKYSTGEPNEFYEETTNSKGTYSTWRVLNMNFLPRMPFEPKSPSNAD